MNVLSAVDQFRDAMVAAGLPAPSEIEPDGKLHRFAANGKRSDDSGWFVLFGDGIPAGAFGCWREGVPTQTWRADIGRKLSPHEEAEHRARIDAIRREREAEDAERRAEASAKAQRLWSKARPANGHPYLVKKGVKATATLRTIDLNHAAAILEYRPRARGEGLTGKLLVAPVKVGDAISTVELIDEAGRKSALAGGQKGGGYWATGPLPAEDGADIVIAEGVATALSIAEATGHCTLAALSCGNLLAVAKAMRTRYPRARLVVASDIGNGEADAKAAAHAAGALLALPDFGGDRPVDCTDMNDLMRHLGEGGAESVRRCVAAARAPEVRIPQPSPENGPEPVLAGAHAGGAVPDGVREPMAARPSVVRAEKMIGKRAAAKEAKADGPVPELAQHLGEGGAEVAESGYRAAAVASSLGPQTADWPGALDAEALEGLAGDIVRAIEPHTESDPAAILLQTLVAFGALVGRGPHVRVEGDEHHMRLFAILTGRSSKARKGTSWGRVRDIFASVMGWPRVVDGLSSGEGLKWAVRDTIRKTEKDKHGFAQEVEVDGGVPDKRVLVMESEFAQVLRQCARPGNTLSATIRSAWDNGNLQTLTKNDPITATGAHICIVGHITADELRAELTATDSANGFANRFLFMAVERSKRLPFGGEDLDPTLRGDLCERIASAAAFARNRGQVEFTPAAREVWKGAYDTLSEGYPGLLGAVTARAEAQTLRLALAYALLDGEPAIDVRHLQAALAMWERCEASARFVFGAALGDRVADTILRSIRASGEAGMTRTRISALFSKNETAERISTALALLESKGLAKRRKVDGAGRPSEVWGIVWATK